MQEVGGALCVKEDRSIGIDSSAALVRHLFGTGALQPEFPPLYSNDRLCDTHASVLCHNVIQRRNVSHANVTSPPPPPCAHTDRRLRCNAVCVTLCVSHTAFACTACDIVTLCDTRRQFRSERLLNIRIRHFSPAFLRSTRKLSSRTQPPATESLFLLPIPQRNG